MMQALPHQDPNLPNDPLAASVLEMTQLYQQYAEQVIRWTPFLAMGAYIPNQGQFTVAVNSTTLPIEVSDANVG